MEGKVEWTGGSTLDGINSSGDRVSMNWEEGPSPMQVVLQCVGACSLVDVVDGVKGREIRSAHVDLTSERAKDPPRVFTKIHMNYVVDSDAPEVLLRRLVEKSHEKYCSVSNMLIGTVDITWELNVL